MYSETFRKLKLYESIYPGELRLLRKKNFIRYYWRLITDMMKNPFLMPQRPGRAGRCPKAGTAFRLFMIWLV